MLNGGLYWDFKTAALSQVSPLKIKTQLNQQMRSGSSAASKMVPYRNVTDPDVSFVF
jgi:hypothetical protein